MLNKAVDLTRSKLPAHWAGIVDRTGRGSYWTKTPAEVETLIRAAKPCAVTCPAPGARYFEIASDEVIGHEDIEILDGFSNGVFVRMGSHGPELCILSDAESMPVRFGFVIVGPDDDFPTSGDVVVWSAFPGRLPPERADEGLLKEIWNRAMPGVTKVWLFPKELTDLIGCAAKRVK